MQRPRELHVWLHDSDGWIHSYKVDSFEEALERADDLLTNRAGDKDIYVEIWDQYGLVKRFS